MKPYEPRIPQRIDLGRLRPQFSRQVVYMYSFTEEVSNYSFRMLRSLNEIDGLAIYQFSNVANVLGPQFFSFFFVEVRA